MASFGRMRRLIASLLLIINGTLTFGEENSAPPPWAYGFQGPEDPGAKPAPPPASPAPDSTKVLNLPDTSQRFTRAQIIQPFEPADWYPQDHTEMPPIVANGRAPDVWACALCHYPNGQGRPENASVVGLPLEYFVEQINAFKTGQRQSADHRKFNTSMMAAYAREMSEEEILAAARYYGAAKFRPWIKVVEADEVPTATISVGLFLPTPDGKKEPLGARILEVPADVERVEYLRDPRAGFIAYVPRGSVRRGADLVEHGGGKTVACAGCHGSEQHGIGNVPPIAGRSPSYLMRQLVDIKRGTRNGSGPALMKPVVAQLSGDDMRDIVAYLASLSP